VRKPSPVLWTVRLRLAADPAEAAEMALEPFALALSRYEVDGGKLWEVEALIEGAPDAGRSARPWRRGASPLRTAAVARLGRRKPQGPAAHRRRPLLSPRQPYRGPGPRGKLALLIDAGAAFGTGRHESTRGCLIALDRLARAGRVFARVLDLGCGSGVLALAAARLWPGPVLAADNDPDAVRVARENVILNGLAGRVRVLRSPAMPPRASAAPPPSISSSPISSPAR
jgi:Ribosomal protein L11 methylase